MENKHSKKNSKKTLNKKRILIVILLVAIIIGIVIVTNKKNNKTIPKQLIGVYVYDEHTKYEFKKDGKGAMYIDEKEYKYSYTYSEKENQLKLDFEKEEIYDATYTATINDNTLKLIGGEGTTGGEYTLKKESK